MAGVADCSVSHVRTPKFSVLGCGRDIQDTEKSSSGTPMPIISLVDLLLHNEKSKTADIQSQLETALTERGFCLLTCPIDSKPGRVIQNLQASIKNDLFPAVDGSVEKNAGKLPTSDTLYISEKGVPMYKLGYELAQDHVREFYRINGGDEGDCPLPGSFSSTWRQGMGLCRHVTDTALDLLTSTTKQLPECPVRRKRPRSGAGSWNKPPSTTTSASLRERPGDYSVFYSMHYFNNPNDPDTKLPADGIALAAHVDPSLLVMEPFLCPNSRGLQVWDRIGNTWLDCDGPESPLRQAAAAANSNSNREQVVSLLFGGKALAAHTGIEAALHRVVAGSVNRRTCIYEQKYEEFYPPPSMD